MDVLSHSSYEQMIQGATALAKNAWGVSVMQLVDGQLAKLFRPPLGHAMGNLASMVFADRT